MEEDRERVMMSDVKRFAESTKHAFEVFQMLKISLKMLSKENVANIPTVTVRIVEMQKLIMRTTVYCNRTSLS